jgi:hypothetical protein
MQCELSEFGRELSSYAMERRDLLEALKKERTFAKKVKQNNNRSK